MYAGRVGSSAVCSAGAFNLLFHLTSNQNSEHLGIPRLMLLSYLSSVLLSSQSPNLTAVSDRQTIGHEPVNTLVLTAYA